MTSTITAKDWNLTFISSNVTQNATLVQLCYNHTALHILLFVDSYSPVSNKMGGLNKRRSPTDNLNINKRGVQIKRVGWKLFSIRSGSQLPLIMGIALAKSQSARGVFHQPAFIGDCLNISHTCLPSHVFVSFAFLMFSVFTFQEKWESLHSRLRQD